MAQARPDLSQRQQELIAPRREKLRLLESTYLRSKELIRTPEWQAQRDKALQDVAHEVNAYMGEEPTRAVFILGQIKEILRQVAGPLRVIRDYEAEKQAIKDIEQRDI